MKIIIAGGSGFLGASICAHFRSKGHHIVVLTRGKTRTEDCIRYVQWDGKSIGPWVAEFANADVLINLTGKNVNCRYNARNKDEILRSRIDSVKVLAEAISTTGECLPLWIQSSSATIYRHAEDRPMTEAKGEFGRGFSVDVCCNWEKAFDHLHLPGTRKVILRTGIVFGRTDGAFTRMRNLVRYGLGGKMGNGTQYISWIHERDFIRIVLWIISNPSRMGIYNCTAPAPIQNEACMQALREAYRAPLGLPSPEWLLKCGAWLIGTETELILKSRWVLPERLQQEGFVFTFPDFRKALTDLTNQ